MSWPVDDDDIAAIDAFKTHVNSLLQLEENKEVCNIFEWSEVNDTDCLRFLRARKMNVDVAAKMCLVSSMWKHEYGVKALRDVPRPHDDVLKWLVSVNFHKFDRHGRPVYIEKTGRIHCNLWVKHVPPEIVVKTHVWFLEIQRERMLESSEKLKQPVAHMVNIMDMKGIHIGFRKLTGLFGAVSKIDQDYYPEHLGSMWFINCPYMFTALWSIVKRFLDKRTLEKIHILGSDVSEMVEELGEECIPEEYGGTCRCEGGCMPPQFTLAELNSVFGDGDDDLVTEDANLQFSCIEQYIGRRDHFETQLSTIKDKDENIFTWYFSTIARDIEFSVIFKPGDDTMEPIVVQEQQRFQSHQKPVRGKYQTKLQGSCIFNWNNKFSRFYGKTLKYTCIVDPVADNDSV